jgi:prepilin-type processing-associated H-X9-DG protein
MAACEQAGPTATPRHTKLEEWSGQRWADGNVFYARYHHILPPNSVSCNFGSEDFDAQVVVTATSRHPGGVNLLLADGSVRFVSDSVQPNIWRSLGSIAGGEQVNATQF